MTIGFLLPFFPLTLAFHIISVVLWMAGMLTLPWLYVEHSAVSPRGEVAARLSDMERRLMKRAINPSMYATWLFGILLVLTPGAMSWSAGWWWTKLTAVVLLSGFHGILSKWRRDFRDGRNALTPRFYQGAALVPPVLLFLIVIMVVIKPF